jgi:hypothetical protein
MELTKRDILGIYAKGMIAANPVLFLVRLWFGIFMPAGLVYGILDTAPWAAEGDIFVIVPAWASSIVMGILAIGLFWLCRTMWAQMMYILAGDYRVERLVVYRKNCYTEKRLHYGGEMRTEHPVIHTALSVDTDKYHSVYVLSEQAYHDIQEGYSAQIISVGKDGAKMGFRFAVPIKHMV